MQITCDNCTKSFNLDETLISKEGRYLQCGSCNHKWFFKPQKDKKKIIHKEIKKDDIIIEIQNKVVNSTGDVLEIIDEVVAQGKENILIVFYAGPNSRKYIGAKLSLD